VGPKASLEGRRTFIFLYLTVCLLMDLCSYQAFSSYTEWCHQQSLEQLFYMISRSKTFMMNSAAFQSALPTSPEVWSTFNCHQPTISCIVSLVIWHFFLFKLVFKMIVVFHLDGHETERKTFSNFIFFPYHPIYLHFMLITVVFTGADLSTISWIHSLSTEMVERCRMRQYYITWYGQPFDLFDIALFLSFCFLNLLPSLFFHHHHLLSLWLSFTTTLITSTLLLFPMLGTSEHNV